MRSPPLYLAGLGHALGELQPLEPALADRVDPALLAKLREQGFASIAVASDGPLALARRATATLLHDHGVDPAHVDAVVYTTCSYWSAQATAEGGLGALVRAQLLGPLGLHRARLHGVFLAESGNLVSALRVARSLIEVDGLRNVLVITADAVPDRPVEYRAMPSAVTVNSDAAAAALVSSHEGAYALEGIGQASSPRMLAFIKGEGLAKYLAILAGIRSAVARLFEAAGTQASDYARLVTNNYSVQTLHGFAGAVGIPRERLFLANVARFAHAFAADPLINLADDHAAQPLGPGERVLCLSTGPLTWGAVSLRRC